MEDDDERANVLADAQAQIVKDQPWSVLYWINQLTALSNDIGGSDAHTDLGVPALGGGSERQLGRRGLEPRGTEHTGPHPQSKGS